MEHVRQLPLPATERPSAASAHLSTSTNAAHHGNRRRCSGEVTRLTRVDARAAAGTVDVFVYVVVLNLFVEYLPAVVSETFTLSVLTAVLLKVVLEVVVAAKTRVRAWFGAATGPAGKVLAALALWAVLFGSKFVVLEVVDLVFGEAVTLGGFFSVTLLILVLMLARAGVRWMLARPHTRVPMSAGRGASP